MTPEEKHARFLRELRDSQPAVMAVASFLLGHGFPVHLQPSKYAPRRSEASKYSDQGDIHVPERGVVEVKRKKQWKGEWPYPEEFRVETVPKWNRKKHQPWLYVFVDNDLTRVAILRVDKTFDDWTRSLEYWGNDQEEVETYMCKTAMLTFEDIAHG